jgi:translation initiation factor IF-3
VPRRSIETKELKLRPATDVHDYQVKVRSQPPWRRLAAGPRCSRPRLGACLLTPRRPAAPPCARPPQVRAAQKFLSKGARVKLTLQFKGREMEFKELGAQMFGRFVEDMGEEAQVEQAPMMQGRQMNMVLAPRKEAP